MPKKHSNLSAYAIASQFAYAILSPLIVFIVGGYYATKHFGWPDWAMGLCVGLGILFMLCGGISQLTKIMRIYGKDNEKAPKIYSSREDNDYYDNYK